MTTFGVDCPTCHKPKGFPASAREWKTSGRRDHLWVRCNEHDEIMQPTQYYTKEKRKLD